jgi:3-hydroxyacyl-CoA dehydrogenase
MTEVRTVAVIGAGIMGRGIAHAAALGGYRTILEDLLPATRVVGPGREET